MTQTYLFSTEGLAALSRYVAPGTLFAFDLDGTLAPIVDDYAGAQVAEPVRLTMERLVNLAKVAVITGRSRKDAQRILGFEPHLIIGNHGAEWPPHEVSRNWQYIGLCLKWKNKLHDMLFYEQGVEIEFKGESLSVHYRKAEDRECVLRRINAAIGKLEPSPRSFGGKCVVNLVPTGASAKGDALVASLDMLGLKRVIYFGDDVTDENVFQLKGIDLFGIRIGEDEQTAASFYLSKQSELLGLLNSMVGMLELNREEEKRSISG